MMQHSIDSLSRRSFTVLFGTVIFSVFFLRYLWSLSLGNGDELFFSTGGGRFAVSGGSWSEWGDFMAYIWQVHNGRTIDWLAASIYVFGPDSGRWLASITTVLSVVAIVCLLFKIFTSFDPNGYIPTAFGPIALLSFLFAYSLFNLSTLANLTLYSASAVNYFVPSALLISVIALATTGRRTSTLYIASGIALVTATMHEQMATLLAALIIPFVWLDNERWSIWHRSASAFFATLGIAEMFLSPGLHNKISQAAVFAPQESISLPRKIVTTFYAFGVYFPHIGLLVSLAVALYLLRLVQCEDRRKIGIFLLFALLLSTFVWAASIAPLFVGSPTPSQAATGLSCICMMIIWLLSSLLSTSHSSRFSALFIICAEVSLLIPAAAGLGAVRVYNYSVIFFLAFLFWTALIALNERFTTGASLPAVRTMRVAAYLFLALLVLASMWVMGASYLAFKANYEPGLQSISQQNEQCSQQICPSVDPQLPFPKAFSGYGTHDYSSTESVLAWLEK